MTDYDWWEETRTKLRQGEINEVAAEGPPCARCKWWRPSYDPHHKAISLCTVPFGQYQDFSCFEVD